MVSGESVKEIDEVSNDMEEEEEIDKQSRAEDEHEQEEEEANDGDNEKEEVNYEREGEEIEDELEEGKSKLGEGFYEIEAIRKKRVHKGQQQYLIKWRDYPESANTWEPYDNLELCADVVEAFEEMSTNLAKSSKKKMRSLAMQKAWAAKRMKHTSPSPSKNLNQNENEIDQKERETESRSLSLSSGQRGRGKGRRRGRPRIERSQVPTTKSANIQDSSQNDHHLFIQKTPVEVEKEEEEEEEEMKQEQEKEKEKVEEQEREEEREKEREEEREKTGEKDKDICINLSPLKTPQSPQGVITGAKKRKSGCVRRFVSQQSEDGMDEDSNSNLVKQQEQGDESILANKITKIIKTVKLKVDSSSATNYVQQVSVTFQALRSDGTEVLVDNKELKATNPLLLIDYYEKNLRYNPNP